MWRRNNVILINLACTCTYYTYKTPYSISLVSVYIKNKQLFVEKERNELKFGCKIRELCFKGNALKIREQCFNGNAIRVLLEKGTEFMGMNFFKWHREREKVTYMTERLFMVWEKEGYFLALWFREIMFWDQKRILKDFFKKIELQ